MWLGESYLAAHRILEAARQTGAEAIHPGYGFLSENADFAQACAAAGVVFIGPTPDQLRAFGLKHTARELAKASGVPLLPGVATATELMAALEAGADDISDNGDSWQVACEPSTLFELKAALEGAGLEVLSAESTMLASNTIPVTDVEDARKIMRIIDALEDNDDVQDVYSNLDIADELMAQLES